MRILAFTIAIAGALVLAGADAASQENAPKQPSPAEMQEMMKKWQEIATPGPAHRVFDNLVGKWETTSSMWWSKDSPPQQSKGTSDVRWIMDGRYVLEEVSGDMMGMAWKGMGVTGYDNFKKKYVFTFLDNMGTAILTGEGDFDAKNNVLTSYGKMDEPLTGEKNKTVKYVTRVISKDKHVFEIYDLVGTPHEFKVIEMVYTRKQ
jgi:hypothetical protein